MGNWTYRGMPVTAAQKRRAIEAFTQQQKAERRESDEG